jgi:hypothetical protein
MKYQLPFNYREMWAKPQGQEASKGQTVALLSVVAFRRYRMTGHPGAEENKKGFGGSFHFQIYQDDLHETPIRLLLTFIPPFYAGIARSRWN